MKNIDGRLTRLPIVAVMAFALVASSCSGSATTTLTEAAVDAAAEQPEPTAVPESTQAPEPTAETAPEPEPTAVPEPTATPEPEAIFFGSDLQVGDCFDRLPDNPPFQPPTMVDCNELHEEEVFGTLVLDDPAGTPFPGRDALSDRVLLELCDDATVEFAGASLQDIPVAVILLFPIEEEWDAGDRTVMCSAASHVQGAPKIGTAGAGTLDSTEVLIARAGLTNEGEEFDDWVVVVEHSIINTFGSLTDGQFDLPLRRPFPVTQGFMFNARAAGDDDHATSTWGYTWETSELTDLGSILPGYELSSTIAAQGSILFAARATPEDDFDIWSTVSGDAEIIVGGDGDQQYPTVNPDQSKLVYQDNGDIWVADVDGSNPLQLTSGPANDWESIVSPDGRTVVFASDRSGNDDLWAVDINGGEPVNLTNHPADESWPVFSENGEYIYFTSDRLAPEDDQTRIMFMNADGSNQSYFANGPGSHPILVPSTIAVGVLNSAPTLNERYSYELLEGEAGTTINWAMSNGRVSIDLPVGWRVGESEDGLGFLASPKPDQYNLAWDVDGVNVSLYDGETEEAFFTIVDGTNAVQFCEQFDGTGGVAPIDDNIVGLSANFDCGTSDAVGGVIAFYNRDTGVGVIIEGQRDNRPDADSDSEMLTAIARSIVWG